jgi:dTMP kinase
MAQTQAGRFITLEGGEGAGKSTQTRRLAAFLRTKGIDVVTTREPGGTDGAEAIRSLLVDGPPDRWDAWTEALLMIAARRDHVIRLIRPALAEGRWVVCDRFADSTLAYQGAAGSLGIEALSALMAPVLEGCTPDLTLMVDLPVAEGLDRADTRGSGEDRFEKRGLEFHEKVRQAFLAIAANDPGRCQVIDGSKNADDVQWNIESIVLDRLF